MKKSSILIQAALTGMGIGFAVTVASLIAFNGINELARELLVWLIASALFGIISGFVFYLPNSFSLPAAMGIHFGLCTLVGCAAAWLCGYADSFRALLVSFIPVFVVIYAIIYLAIVLVMKHNEKQINDSLNQK